MNAQNTNTTTAFTRTGLRAAISPRGRRHPQAVAVIRFAVGTLLTVIGSILIARGYVAAGIVLLSVAVVHFTWGSWQLTSARSSRPHLSGR